MKLSLFDKGLHTRLDPTLIQVDEAVIFDNIDNSSGVLKSAKSLLQTTTAVNTWFYLFNTKWYSSTLERDYIEYKSKLYFTEAGSDPQKVNGETLKLLGIEAPLAALTSVQGAAGALNGVAMSLPNGIVEGISWHPSELYVAIANQSTPYITIYKLVNGSYTLLANPLILPTGNAKAVAYSPNGLYLAVAHETAPYVTVYQINGDTYTKIPDPGTTPTGNGQGIAWSPDSTMLTVAHTTTPFVTIYTFASNVLTKLANPASLPAGNGTGCQYSADQVYMTVTHETTPFITIYKISSITTYTKLSNPASLPTGNAEGVSWSNDGTYMAVAHTTTPFITIYSRSVDTFTKLSDPGTLPTGTGYAIDFSSDFTYLAVAHDVSPFMTIYSRSGSTFTKLTNANVLPTGTSYAIKWSPDTETVLDGHAVSPFLTVYTRSGSTITQYTNPTTVQYTYTYYDSTEGVESAPAPMSIELSIASGTSVDLSNFIDSSNSAVDTLRLYRLGANATIPILLVELPLSTIDGTYNDNIPTLNAIGNVLDSYNNQKPLSGLRFMTQYIGTLFAALGPNLYFTQSGFPDYWPSGNFIAFEHDITGILRCADGLIVFTDRTSDMLVGSDPSNFTKVFLSDEQGCLNHKSCKVVSNKPTWISADGVCFYQYGMVQVISKEKLGKTTLNIVNASSYDTQYWLCMTDGSLFVMDLRFFIAFKTFHFSEGLITDIGKFDNVLYTRVNGFVANMFAGDDLTLHYRSPDLTEGDASQEKLYNDCYVRYNGDFVIKTYIDGVYVATQTLSGDDIANIKPPQEKQRGSSIQFDIIGTGTIKEIEYKVVGRQNGR